MTWEDCALRRFWGGEADGNTDEWHGRAPSGRSGSGFVVLRLARGHRDLGNRSIAGLARGEQDDQRAATAVDRGVDLRTQPAARPAESVIARFVLAAARILVTRPSPSVLFEPRTILPNNTFG